VFLVWVKKMPVQNLTGSASGAGSSREALSVPQDFLNRVKQAINNVKAEGIELWKPSISEELKEIFIVSIVRESEGCTNQQCGHVSHDPASPYIKLIPKSGKLIYLGNVEYGEQTFYYYALLTPNGTRYFEVVSKQFFWDRLYEVESFIVPDILLARFGEGK